MKRITRSLVSIPAALALIASPVLAADEPAASGEPVKLTDSELNDVTAGGLLDIVVTIQNSNFVVQLNNVSINAATVVQVNVGGNAFQWAQAIAIQGSAPAPVTPTQP